MTTKQRHPILLVLVSVLFVVVTLLLSVAVEVVSAQQRSEDEINNMESLFELERRTNPKVLEEAGKFGTAMTIGSWHHYNYYENYHQYNIDNEKSYYHLEKSRIFLEFALQMYRWQLTSRLQSPAWIARMKSLIYSLQTKYNEIVQQITESSSSGDNNRGGDDDDADADAAACDDTDAAATATTTNSCLIKSDDNDDEQQIDWTDPIFLRVGYDNDPVVIESHKLIFFPIPKNANTQFKILFRRMMGYHHHSEDNNNNNNNNKSMRQAEIDDWNDLDKVWDPLRNGLSYLGQYSRKQQQEFMLSDEWTRAVFVRDPLERLVSAYKFTSLAQEHPNEPNSVIGGTIKQNCCSMNRARPHGDSVKNPHCLKLPSYTIPVTETNFPFDTFVKHFLPNCFDFHWTPQSNRMSPASWKLINFVGHFDSLKDDTHNLLKRIGAYDEFGRSGWGSNNESIFETNEARHATNTSSSKIEEIWKQYYFRPPSNNNSDDSSATMSEVGSLALDFYRKDYDFVVTNSTTSLFRRIPPIVIG
jgi:hypothetical protein